MMDVRESELLDALDTAVAETFEMMAFMEVRRQEDEVVVPDSPVIVTLINILEPVSGKLAFYCEQDLADEITESLFMDLEESELELKRADAHAEFANTIAGRVLGLVAPAEEKIAVGLPHQTEGIPGQSWEGESLACYALDDGRNIFFGYSLDC